ncbi:MAG TPA: methyltransferase domain-containing protein [Chloroflexota bacterium]|nr:methyltransferase domain-containing protein [Chloroflexota bacterium]
MASRASLGISSIEVEVIPGLEEFAIEEIEQRMSATANPRRLQKEGRLALRSPPDLQLFNRLKSVVAVHLVRLFDVPRPQAFLGHENLERLMDFAQSVIAGLPKGTFTTFYVSAAGSDSAIFARVKSEIAARLGLTCNDREGDLLLTFRRPPDGGSGWEVLVRTSPRPLAARAWRTCDFPGALNASVAYAMVTLTKPRVDDVFVNLCCGSGTLMVERLAFGLAESVTGYDVDQRALDCARLNLTASGSASEARLLLHDARGLPLPAGSVNALVADLPYAMLVGSARENQRLYPDLLKEAARIASVGARFVLITTARHLMTEVLDDFASRWERDRVIPIKIPYHRGYITPSIYVLSRKS